jgi:hypothetical protein
MPVLEPSASSVESRPKYCVALALWQELARQEIAPETEERRFLVLQRTAFDHRAGG